jgi:hypothetical protein
MRRTTALVAAVACMMTSCATVASIWRSQSADRFDAGVRAMNAGNYSAAHGDLAWVAQHFQHEKEGQRALLLLAGLELDPRNPNRRPEVGADLAAGYRRLPDRAEWMDPLASTLYLLGTELGARDSTPTAPADRAVELPKLPGPTVNARIKAIEAERDRLEKRVAALEQQVAEKDREIERIKKTIKP